MYVLIAIIIALIFLIFTPLESYFTFKYKAQKASLQFGIVFLSYKINIANKVKLLDEVKKEEKKYQRQILKVLKKVKMRINLKIYIPIEAYSNIYIPNLINLTELSKFFIIYRRLGHKLRVINTYETFMLNGILTVSIWNIIKAILKSR